MAGNESIEAGRSRNVENMVVFGVLGVVTMVLISMYYQYAWYHINFYILKALNYLPYEVTQYLFFWDKEQVKLIPRIFNDFQIHASDYPTHYTEDEVGIKMKRGVDRLLLFMFLPYYAIPAAYLILKEMKRKTSAIKPPRKKGALYAYAQSQKQIWPYIKPVANIMDEMVKNPSLDVGWYALSEIPYSWMKKNDLLQIVTKMKRKKLFTEKERLRFKMDRSKAYLLLRDNLGEPWKGVENLDFTHRCLLAVVVPHIFGKVGISRRINRKINNLYETKKDKPELKAEPKLRLEVENEVNKILSDHKDAFVMPYFSETDFDEAFDPLASSFDELDSEKDMFDKGVTLIQDSLLTHYYVKTLILSLIEKSWTYGVLASSELLWIKTVDRGLWYIVSQQGRTSAFVEVVGAWAHYLAEREFGFKVIVPQLEEGINALDFDLFSTHSNYFPLNSYDDQSKWDRLVPDGIGKGSNFSRPPVGENAVEAM